MAPPVSMRTVIPRAPRVPTLSSAMSSFAPHTLKTPTPWMQASQAAIAGSSRPGPLSTRPISARPIYQHQQAKPFSAPSSSRPPQVNEAALADFFSQFERTSALPHAPVAAPAWRSAPASQAPQSFPPVAMPATSHADDSSRMNVQRGDTNNGLITSRTFVIETKKGGGSWAAFMVAFGALVGVLSSMAVVKYKADQQDHMAAASISQAAQDSAPAQVAAITPALQMPQAQVAQPQMMQPAPLTQPALISQAPQVGPQAPLANVPSTQAPTQPPMQSAFSTGIAAPQVKADAKPIATQAAPAKVEPRRVAAVTAPVKVPTKVQTVAIAKPIKKADLPVKADVATKADKSEPAPKADAAQRMLEAAQRETGNSLN